jgi:hypothetical protein
VLVDLAAGYVERSTTMPESRMARVRATVSSRVMPRKKTAMAKAAIW